MDYKVKFTFRRGEKLYCGYFADGKIHISVEVESYA